MFLMFVVFSNYHIQVATRNRDSLWKKGGPTLQGDDFAKVVGVPLVDFPVFTAREEKVSFRNETETENRILSSKRERAFEAKLNQKPLVNI